MKYKLPIVLLASLFLVSISPSFSQKENANVLVKGTDEYKMFMASQDFNGGDYRSAVNKYKEVLKNRPQDPSLQFFIGQCYFMMREYKDALEFLETAKSLNATNEDLGLFLGKTYHVKGMLDKALTELIAYKKLINENVKKVEDTEIDVYIAQCNFAKQAMAKPVNVQLIHLLDLNSQYDDKGPVLTNGDKQLVFTSRRPNGNKAITDKEGDFGYFDDIYESNWNEEKRAWSAGDYIKGPINTDFYDACTSISADGTMMFIYRNAPTKSRGGNLYMSKRTASGKWKSPEALPKTINTTYYEDAACISPDGKTLYFISERPGGLGRGDIYVSQNTAEGWGEPVNIGAPVNTSYDENGLYLCPDGKTLFFCSNGPNSMGGYDIFKTVLGSDKKWSVPVNIGYPINTVAPETKFVLAADNKTAYISTVRDTGLGERDIFMIDMSNYDVMTGVSSPSAAIHKSILNGIVSSADGAAIAAADISVTDKSTGVVITSVKSGVNGGFSLEIAGEKGYILNVSAEGYQKTTIDFMLPAGKTESKNIVLNKNN